MPDFHAAETVGVLDTDAADRSSVLLDEHWRVALDKRKIEPYGTETQQVEPLPYNPQQPDLG